MGSLRFRKQFRLAPGVKLTLNKQSASFTVGVRGANLTYNTKGYRTASVGVPGTGLWYRDTRKVTTSWADAAFGACAPSRNVAPELAWMDAHQQEGQAIVQWIGQMADWAEGLDSARWEQAWNLIHARVHEWVQAAMDASQHNDALKIYAQAMQDQDIEAGLRAIYQDFAAQYPAMDWMKQHQDRCANFGRKFANPPDSANRELELQFVAQMVREAKALVNEATVAAREYPDCAGMQEYARATEEITLDLRDGRQVRVLDIEGPD
jgi:hypothetical protein